MQREIERLEDERITLKTENRKLAKQLGGKSAKLGLTPEDLENIQEYTDALKNHRDDGSTATDSVLQKHHKLLLLQRENDELKKSN